MNLILHQFKTDVLHFRWRLMVLWLSFLAEAVLANSNAMGSVGMGISNILLELCQIVFALALIASLVQADALVDTTAGWLTRPVRRGHLFWAKTLFIILCVLTPRAVSLVVSLAWRGYSLSLIVSAVGESLLFGLPFVAVVAVLAALTRDLARFFLAGGITIGFTFVSATIVEMLVRTGLLTAVHLDWPQEKLRFTCAAVMGLLFLGIAAVSAWILQAQAARYRAAAVCLAVGTFAFPITNTVWSKNFLKPKLSPSAPLTLSLLDTNHPLGGGLENQMLSMELAVGGVPNQQVAGIRNVTANVRFLGDGWTTPIQHDDAFSYNGQNRPAQYLGRRYFDTIKEFFPTNTIWFNGRFTGGDAGYALLTGDMSKRFPQGPPPSDIDGEISVDLFTVQKMADVPLQFTSVQAIPGLRVTVRKVSLNGDVINISIDECCAALMLDRGVDTRSGNLEGSGPACTYVLYHPESGEAYVVQQNSASYFPALLAGSTHAELELHFTYPALRERFAGITAFDWLNQARLCVFMPVYSGTSNLRFHQENYHWPWGETHNVRQQKQASQASDVIARATLPPNPTTDQLGAYLDQILANLPEYWNPKLSETIDKKLAAIGAEGLPALLRRLPFTRDAESTFALPVISKLVTRDQLPDLRAGLQRDNNLIDVFTRKHWESDARDVLVAKLSDHREPLPADALRIAAQAKDPATYADLRWHFVRLQYGQDEVLAALKQCPGFDAEGAVREAWQFAQLGITSRQGIAPIAAGQGLPGALNATIAGTASMVDGNYRKRELEKLAMLTGYTGPKDKTLTWLVANLEQFQFDPAQRRYVLSQPQ